MRHLRLPALIILTLIVLLVCSCFNPANKAKGKNDAQATADNSASSADSSVTTKGNTNKDNDAVIKNADTLPGVQQNNNADSMLSQMKDLTSIFGKDDSGILKNIGDGGNMDGMMKKMQAMMGDKNGNPGDAIANSLLNLQLGQMSDNNPLKSVAKGMTEAQKNGTAGPSQTYTAAYTPEQPANYRVPVSGTGNTIVLQYTGGSIENNKKDGLWKNMYISTNKANKWNVYSEGYAESSALNMKVHSTSLAGLHENYSIILNDQYKKYNRQQRSDLGKNDLNMQVQKIGNEKLFGYNCVHIKISYTLNALKQTANIQDDEWYSADVPGSEFLSPVIFENHSPDVVKKIIDDGCSGVLIKSITQSSGSSQLIQLSSIIQKDMPDSTFNLPANYQEDKNTALYDIQ
ncbi:MAG TPA: DUF4412 domain-containing protein [Chitinophagaceae bacterium]|nr:DUF4412 domain-containing protein [Chitinophagaceae bacterium]